MFKTIGKLTIAITLLSLFSGCALIPKDSHTTVYKRDDVNTSKSKVIVFPLLLKSGANFEQANKDSDNKVLDLLVGSEWSDEIGTSNAIVVPKLVLNELPNGWKVLGQFVQVLDNVSAIEQTMNNPELKKFIEELSTKVGDGALGFALVFEDENRFKATNTLHGNMGLFDTKKLTWKWITKHKAHYKVPVPYQVAIKDLFADSWKKLKAENDGKVK